MKNLIAGTRDVLTEWSKMLEIHRTASRPMNQQTRYERWLLLHCLRDLFADVAGSDAARETAATLNLFRLFRFQLFFLLGKIAELNAGCGCLLFLFCRVAHGFLPYL